MNHSMESEFTLKLEKPAPQEYLHLRALSGFGEITLEQSKDSLNNSLFCVSIYHMDKLVGLGRIVGDGVLFFYISDVLASPHMKGYGIGSLIMKELLAYLEKTANRLSTIALLAAPNQEDFYTKFGFEECPNRYFGKGLSYTKWVELEL